MNGLQNPVCAKFSICWRCLGTDMKWLGFIWTFATQAIVCTVGILPTYFILQKFGWALRGEMDVGFEEQGEEQ